MLPVAKLVSATGTYWCWGGDGIWRVGSKLGAVVAAEPLCKGDGGAGTYPTWSTDSTVSNGSAIQVAQQHKLHNSTDSTAAQAAAQSGL